MKIEKGMKIAKLVAHPARRGRHLAPEGPM